MDPSCGFWESNAPGYAILDRCRSGQIENANNSGQTRSGGISCICSKSGKQGVRTVGNHTAALRFFFCKTLKRNYPIEEVPYPRAPRKLPIILTQEEAVRKRARLPSNGSI
jgi:site-specific recombinase XerC